MVIMPPHPCIRRCIKCFFLEELGQLHISLHSFCYRCPSLLTCKFGSSVLEKVTQPLLGCWRFRFRSFISPCSFNTALTTGNSSSFMSICSRKSFSLTSSMTSASSMVPRYLVSKMVAFVRRFWISDGLYLSVPCTCLPLCLLSVQCHCGLVTKVHLLISSDTSFTEDTVTHPWNQPLASLLH